MVNLKKKKKVKIVDDDNVDNSTPSTSAATPFKPRTARKRIKTEIKSEPNNPIEVSNVQTPPREIVDIANADIIFHNNDDPNEERRIDPCMPACGTYTKRRFLEFYGESVGEVVWHNAWKLPGSETKPQPKPEEQNVSPLHSPIHISIDDDVDSQADTECLSEPECSRDCVCRSCIKFEEVGCTINTIIKGGGS